MANNPWNIFLLFTKGAPINLSLTPAWKGLTGRRMECKDETLDGPAGSAKTTRDGAGSPKGGSLFIIHEPVTSRSTLIRRKNKGLFSGKTGVQMQTFGVLV